MRTERDTMRMADEAPRAPSGSSSGTRTASSVKPSISNHESIERKFRRLADLWYDETGDSSIVSYKLVHPAYIEIINLGHDVVPFILRELENEEGHWFLALAEIT